ncbi:MULTISPECIES: branched-chain amino acid ABC transporter permease [unclassified Caballeronia]|uniref:branched-chain amino acid ABC transporter permease n=1 Tax=unclassified Caballeronia TaxID=2646786 RepID=UPI00286133D9|nr:MULTISPECIES: branched-chain amino acid ABC transporter permease [unclassified Caballeronia]MDR5815256.1 branched-chain amino acid ABC transporter permease [Caballeronia sp. LZ033]MDR5822601.1 branched-chain amino acid ABC transporter permease [Caballeronia sp. LZ043]
MDVLLSEPVQALISINVLLTLSLLFPFAAGVWSLGLPGFMAVGAYTASWLTVSHGWPVAAALPMGALAGALVTLPFALLTLRIRGIYLAIATLAAAELIQLFFSHYEATGGVMGLAGIPYLGAVPILALAVAAALVSGLLFASRFGKALVAVGSDPTVAACHGLNVPALQFTALALGGALAGLAGGCFAHFYSFISPANFGFLRSTDVLMFLIVGGLTPAGAVLGAAVLSAIPQVVTSLEKWAPALYGVIVMLMTIYMPQGLLPRHRLGRWFKPRRNVTPRRAAKRLPVPVTGQGADDA